MVRAAPNLGPTVPRGTALDPKEGTTMTTRSWKTRTGAGVLALALLAGACGSDDGADEATAEAVATSAPLGADAAADGAAAVATPAADLRAMLTAALTEHVYLSGIAVLAAVHTPEAFDAAAATLDANSRDIAAAIGSVYGDEAGEVFLELWRTHIGFFVDYANARAAGDQAAADAALAALDAYGGDLGQFLQDANPNLDKEAVAEEFRVHVSSLADAIDATVAGEPDAFDELKAAASHMPATAAVLAGGIAAHHPEQFGG